ncbi:MAG: fumarylacetoacetate hydrolase family protein [Deltaproteobacteria bacterium]|jgi:2-keto-4-pentenoate hydratase|nr:fumarylacetoacetate hydrolase family protein [Deltaproteobacteria bacterium]
MDPKTIAIELHEALKAPRQIEAPTKSNPGLSLADAYAIQMEGLKLRQSEGQTLIGLKIGLTSQAMQNLLGVKEPDFGQLTDRMLLLEGEACKRDQLLQPKVEGELAFCLNKNIKGPGVTVADVFNATAFVSPVIEIVDSRVKDWKITLADTVADNGSSAMFMLGGRMTPIHEIDMRLVGMTLEKNGRLVNSGCGAEVLGNPAAAVAWLANKMAEFGTGLPSGMIVLSGAFTAAQNAEVGDSFTASFTGMGSVTVSFS